MPYLSCDVQHDEVRWTWVAGYECWYCGRTGKSSMGAVITPTTDTPTDSEARWATT